MRGVAAAGADATTVAIQARDATGDDLLRVHSEAYIERARRDCLDGGGELSTGDTAVCEASYDAALRAAGGVLAGVDAVMAGTCRNAFCAVRPPGHHATPDRGMGFCIFNNVAIAARYLQRRHGLKRILIADWDVHHGNGTQETFYRDPTVFFFSTHQWPLYPGTGAASERGVGDGMGYTMNVPVAAGSGRQEIVGAFRERLVPAMTRFRPEFVLVSAGFDSRMGDPLGGLLLTDDDFAELTEILMEIAGVFAQGRLVAVLEGGYSLDGLALACEAHVRALGRLSSR
jgi:acetoin utilization deacetylase AcuC-like enzyme